MTFLTDTWLRFLIAVLTPTIGFLVWFIKRNMDARAARRSMVRALYAEIDFNTRDMERFRRNSPPPEVLSQVLRDNPDRIPHVTDARHTEVYRANIAHLHFVSDNVLQHAVDFYGVLEKVRVQVDGLNYPSFQTLPPESRVQAVELIRATTKSAEISGKRLMAEFEREYPKLRLTRFNPNGQAGNGG